MTDKKDSIEFWQAGEWAMVYLNGELVRFGDHYLAAEWLQERCGVVVVDDQNGASIPDGHSAVRTLAEAERNMRTWQERKAKAIELRKQADELRNEAYWLERGGSE